MHYRYKYKRLMTTRRIGLTIFSYKRNLKDLFLSTNSNLQACLRTNILGTFLPSSEGLGENSFSLFFAIVTTIVRKVVQGQTRNVPFYRLQGIVSFQTAF